MPEIGEIKKGTEIGYKSSHKLIWHACVTCGKKRWVELSHNLPARLRCRKCAKLGSHLGRRSKNWKGGYTKNSYGYREVYVDPDDFFRPMAKKTGYILEHRLVVAKALGRCLLSWEIVHHKKGFAKDDNRYPETLELVSVDEHNQMSIMERRITYLEKRVTLLEAENTLLRAERNALLSRNR